MEPTPAEAAALADVPTPEARSYLSWRLSMAWVGFVAAGVAAILGFIGWITAETENAPAGFRFVGFVMSVGARAALALGLWVTIGRWRDGGGSRRSMRWAWAAAFFLPLSVGLIPVVSFFSDRLPGATQEEVIQREGIKILAGFMYLFVLAPSVLSLFPGAVRAGLTVKTLMPSTAIGPTLAALFAPIYSLGFFVALIVLQQLSGSFLLALGSAFLVAGPLVFVRRSLRLAAPMTSEAASREVSAGRNRARWLLGTGAVLIVVALFDMRVFGMRLIGSGDDVLFGYLTILELGVWYVATLTTFTAVAADAMVEGATAMLSRKPWWLATEEGRKAEEQVAAVSSVFPAPPPPTFPVEAPKA